MPFILANPFQPLIDVFDWMIVFIHDSIGLSWGMSIIALTVVVRIALLPLTIKQFKSMAALQRLTPEIKKLQEKYRDDRQRLNQEMMKFYQENKVNPFSSCLPLLLQLPVFLALFYLLREDLRFDICRQTAKPCDLVSPGSADFGFIADLTDKATGSVLVALIVLYVGSQLGSSVLMSVSADRNQRILLIALPFLFVPFILSFPAGLIVYWITTNFWTVGQQFFIRRYVTHHPAPAAAPAGAAAVAGGRTKTPPAARGAPAPAGESGTAAGGTATKAPPRPPRKKKKRSGRRR